MRKLIVATGLVAFAVAAPAQQLLQCANPDVLNSLVFNGRPESKLVVTLSLPSIVAGFRAPAAFTLIGSAVRGQNASTVVAYKTTLETTPAFDSLLAFLADEGWKRESTPQFQLPMAIVVGQQPAAAQLCRNGERRNMQVREIDGVRYATITSSGVAVPRECDAPALQSGFVDPIAAMNAARADLPQLSFPDSARQSAVAPGSDHSSSTSISTTARIDSPDSAASLVRHLARQLVQQGWRGDAEWSGSTSAGSTWSRRNAQGQALLGMLEVLKVNEGAYEIGFTMTRPPQQGLL